MTVKKTASVLTLFAVVMFVLSGCATTATNMNDGIPTGPAYRPQLKPEITNLEVARKKLADLISGENAKVIAIKTPAMPSSCKDFDRSALLRFSQGAPGKANLYCGVGDRTMYVQFTDYKIQSNGISASDTVFLDNHDLCESAIDVEKIPFAETQIAHISFVDSAVDSRPYMFENSPRPYRVSLRGGYHFYFIGLKEAAAFADQLYFIQQKLKIKEAEQAADFARKAAVYREAKVKPAVSEEQRKYIVQANVMNQRKAYAKAVGLYLHAVEIDPVAYPGAYFNLALLSAQMERYQPAISYMKQYLLLEPEAKDARSAQDKIYEWEALQGAK